MTTKLCRWGILGAATIARKNWQAIRDAGNATLVAVASRDSARSAAFIADCQAAAPFPETPAALDSYEALLAHPEIDAVYIPLPTGLRKQWILRAAAAGKHVLAEKPVGRNAAEVREIVEACARHGVQFMDGVMFMHGKRLQRLRQLLDDGREIGTIRHIASQFSFAGDESFLQANIRANGVLEPLGCLGDLGWYCLRFTLWALNYALPVRVSGRIHRESVQAEGVPAVPLEFSGSLDFADGVSASFHCSFTAQNAQWAVISGTAGLLQLRDFVLPFSGRHSRFSVTRSRFVTQGCQFDMHEDRRDEELDESSSNAPDAQECGLFRRFSELVLSGRHDAHWPEIALKTQQVLDACLASARQGGVPVPLA